MILPSELSESLDDYPGDLGHRWAAELPGRLAAAEERWGITIGAPFQPGGVTSYAARATTSDGVRCVYKITVPHDEALGEDAALEAYAGDAAVRLLASRPETFELLLEHAVPGHDLWTLPDDEERLDIGCELMTRLWRPVAAGRIVSLAQTAATWADITERRLITSEVPWVTGPIERGVDLLRSLPAETTESVLLHGDFHPGNILAAEREPWLAIDPKPLVGDPAYEPVQLLTQRGGRIAEPPAPADVERRLAAIADRLQLDADRIARWAIARCAEWSMWSWDRGDTIDAAIAYTWARTLDHLA